jgi:hypothetical protein
MSLWWINSLNKTGDLGGDWASVRMQIWIPGRLDWGVVWVDHLGLTGGGKTLLWLAVGYVVFETRDTKPKSGLGLDTLMLQPSADAVIIPARINALEADNTSGMRGSKELSGSDSGIECSNCWRTRSSPSCG